MIEQKNEIPFLHKCCVPVFLNGMGQDALRLGALMGAKLHLIGVSRTSEASPSSGHKAEELKRKLRELSGTCIDAVDSSVLISANPWNELQTALKGLNADLLCLDWESLTVGFGITPTEMYRTSVCNTAILRGSITTTPRKILLPVRGGPQAELSLRIAMSLRAKEIDALHFVSPDIRVDSAFKGLSRIFPQVPGIHPRYETSKNPSQQIVEECAHADLVIMGSSATPTESDNSFGFVADKVLKESKAPVLLVHSIAKHPEYYEDDILEALLRRADTRPA